MKAILVVISIICLFSTMNCDDVSSVRNEVKGLTKYDNIINFLAEKYKKLKTLGLSIYVDSQKDLIPYLADDLRIKDPKLTKEAALKIAEQQIIDNKTTALTTSTDKFIAIKGGEAFDELHEYMHILSGKGGENALRKINNGVNEGAINYISELVSPKAGVNVIQRYPLETPYIKNLFSLIPDGVVLLFQITFQEGKGMDQFLKNLGEVYYAAVSTGKYPNGKSVSFSEKNAYKNAGDTIPILKEKLIEKMDLTWYNNRFVTKALHFLE